MATKEKKDKYPYEKYVKYNKAYDKDAILYTKEEWDDLDTIIKEVEYKDAKGNYYWFPIFYTFLGLIFVGGIVGGIVYGVWIDDILQGILLALGFPIFIIAGFFGAGKGL